MSARARAGAAVLALALAAGPAAAQVSSWPSERPPEPLPGREVHFPPYEVKALANGLRVIVVPQHEQPDVSLRLIVGAGGAHDPADKPGVANLVASLLDQGTKTRSAQVIARTIDDIGGALGTGAGSDLTFVNAVVMKDSFDLVLDLVSDVARNPAFAPEEIERQRQQVLSSLQVSYEDPSYLAGVVFDRLVYGFHPYGRPASGTPQSVPKITPEDLVAFHARYFVPNNTILAVVGDVSATEAFAGVEKAFGGWASHDPQLPIFDDPPQPTRRVIVIDRPGAVQTEIRVGQLAVPRKHPDYMALNMAMKILGGEGANRLQRVLRSERGLTYGASADLETLKQSGDFMAETDTRSESTGEALRVVVDEYWRLRRERVNRAELEGAQDYLAGSFPLTIETPSAIALQILNTLFYGLDLHELETFPERVRAVTPGDIQRVAEEYLKPDRLSIVLVGDADKFVSQLRGAGFDQFERIPASQLDLSAADLRRAAAPQPDGRVTLRPIGWRVQEPAPQKPAAVPPLTGLDAGARALVERAIAARGGLDRLRAVKALRARGITTINGPSGPVKIETTTVIVYPGRMLVVGQLPSGRVAQAYSGGQAWLQDPNGARDAPPAMRDDMRAGLERDTTRVLLDLYDGKVAARTLPEPADAIEARLEGGQVVTLQFEPKSGHLASLQFTVPAPSGKRSTIEEQFSDYRPVDGLQIAFSAVTLRDGVVIQQRTLDMVEVNPAIDLSIFVKPAK